MSSGVNKEQEELAQIKEAFINKYCKGPSPYQKAGFFSKLFYLWLNPIMNAAAKVPLTQDMHYQLRDEDKSIVIANRMEKLWYEIYPKGQLPPGTTTPVGGFLKMIWRTFTWTLFFSITGMIFFTSMEFMNTYLLYLAINEVGLMDYSKSLEANSDTLTNLAYLMSGFIVVKVSSSIFISLIDFSFSVTGKKLSNGLNIMLFKKMMRRSLERDSTFDLGDITNFSQVDTQSISNLLWQAPWIIQTPVRVLLGIVGLIVLMGPIALYTFGIVIIIMWLNTYFSKLYRLNKVAYMRVSDLRGKLTNEIFKNIRYIKMVGMETYFMAKYKRLRDFEIFWIRRQNIRSIAMEFTSTYGTALYIVTLYTLRIATTGTLELNKAFAAAMIFALFAQNFRAVGPYIVFIMDILISATRLSFFMLADELDLSYIRNGEINSSDGSPVAVCIKDGNFYWVEEFIKEFYRREKLRISKKNMTKDEKKEQNIWMSISKNTQLTEALIQKDEKDSHLSLASILPGLRETVDVLKNLNLVIPKGCCVGIIGTIGSGKSSLLSAITGEMYARKGSSIEIDGSLAYVSQKPWITSSTVKDIILFGKPYDEQRFKDSVRFSCLNEDLKIMDNGADTMLGDRGVNLSGGQKTRLAIARALYSDADVYLLDDPISALDINVGKKVMEEGFIRYLKGKTRIIVTHALAYLPYFDHIIVMDEGRIVEQGTYQEITKTFYYTKVKETLEKDEKMIDEEKDEKKIPADQKVKEEAKIVDIDSINEEKVVLKEDISADDQYIDSENIPKEQKIVDEIIASEDRVEGKVITWPLIKMYIMYGGGPAYAITALVCKLILLSSNTVGYDRSWLYLDAPILDY